MGVVSSMEIYTCVLCKKRRTIYEGRYKHTCAYSEKKDDEYIYKTRESIMCEKCHDNVTNNEQISTKIKCKKCNITF